MSTHTALMRSRAGVMTQFAEVISSGLSDVGHFFAARAERRRVEAELSNLSDRDLSDIGINRGDIPHIAGFGNMPALTLMARR